MMKHYSNKTKIIFLLAIMMIPMHFLDAQGKNNVQHIAFDRLSYVNMIDKVDRKYVYGDQSTLAMYKMDKGAKVPLHAHPNEQTSYITKGSVRVTIEGQEYFVKAGEVIIIPANVPHAFESLEDGTLDVDFFAPARMDWINGTENYFMSQLEKVAELNVRPGDVAVSAEGRIFSTIHPLGDENWQLVEIVNGKAIPYPNAQLQRGGKAPSEKTFDGMLGLIFDKNNKLWVIDMGLGLGKTRLWSFDITLNKVVDKIELPTSIAPKGTFTQDVAIDEKNGWAYLADIANPGIIAINLKTKKARRFGGHPSLQAEDKDMIIDGKVIYFGGKPARVAIDPITLSKDRETIFFGAMNGTNWYNVPAKLFRENKSDAEIASAITLFGKKPFSDGALTDADGNHYFTNLQEHAITKLSADGKMSNVVKNNELLLWPDNVYEGHDGWMYISVNELNTTPAFTGGKDEGSGKYYIYKFKKK